MKFSHLAVAAALAVAPISAQAVVLELDDTLGNTISVGAIGSGDAAINGVSVGDFTVNLAFASAEGGMANLRELNTTSFQSSGIGTLVMTATEEYAIPNASGALFGIAGTGSVSNIGDTATVEHLISFDNGATFSQIGDDLFFDAVSGDITTSGVFTSASTFLLRTIVTIVNDTSDETSNVNTTLTATVPLPAPLAFLLTGIAGLGYLSRRKAA